MYQAVNPATPSAAASRRSMLPSGSGTTAVRGTVAAPPNAVPRAAEPRAAHQHGLGAEVAAGLTAERPRQGQQRLSTGISHQNAAASIERRFSGLDRLLNIRNLIQVRLVFHPYVRRI